MLLSLRVFNIAIHLALPLEFPEVQRVLRSSSFLRSCDGRKNQRVAGRTANSTVEIPIHTFFTLRFRKVFQLGLHV
jgi:hypothetical protein